MINISVVNQYHNRTLFRVFDQDDIKKRFNHYQLIKIQLLKSFINFAYQRYGLDVPHVYISNEEPWQAVSIITPHDSPDPSLLILYENNIKNQSMRGIKSVLYHEIGHNFAQSIMKKHHLPVGIKHQYTKLKVYDLSEYIPIIAGVINLIGMLIYPALIGIFVFILLFMTELMLRDLYDDTKTKIQKDYAKEQEYIADEFSLKATHDLNGMLISVYEHHIFMIQTAVEKIQYVEHILSYSKLDANHYAYYERKLARYRKRKCCLAYNNWYQPDAEHPCDKDRVSRAIWFYEHHMKQWR